jgi:hypothetical protein
MRRPFNANSAQEQEPIHLTGVFCDVGNTLLDYNDQINKPLAKALNSLLKKGVEVTIFTGGREVEATGKLLKHKLIDEDLAYGIRHKREFEGTTLQVLIDDDPAEKQDYGFTVYGRHFYPEISDPKKFVAEVMAALQESDAAPASAPPQAPGGPSAPKL